jgi:hypothetical protein
VKPAGRYPIHVDIDGSRPGLVPLVFSSSHGIHRGCEAQVKIWQPLSPLLLSEIYLNLTSHPTNFDFYDERYPSRVLWNLGIYESPKRSHSWYVNRRDLDFRNSEQSNTAWLRTTKVDCGIYDRSRTRPRSQYMEIFTEFSICNKNYYQNLV